jgi:hypothetical protein
MLDNIITEEKKSDYELLAEEIINPTIKVEKVEPTLSELEQQLADLQAKIVEAKRIEEERIRQEELAKPYVIEVREFNQYGSIFVKFDRMNDEFLSILRNTYGRLYDAFTEVNTIPVSSWNVFTNEINALNTKYTIEWKYLKHLDKEIDQYLNEVDLAVDDNGKEFVLTFARRKKQWQVTAVAQDLPGHKVIEPTREIKQYRVNIPLSEGWRIASTIDKYVQYKYIETYTIAEHSLKIINDQIESRKLLDGAALLEDVDIIDIDLNGQTLKDFQKVGVRFACLALGLGDIKK